jgi:hypothetical protein
MKNSTTQAQVTLQTLRVGAFDIENITLYFDVNEISGDATYTGCLIEDKYVELDTNDGGDLHYVMELAIAKMISKNDSQFRDIWEELTHDYGATSFYDFEGCVIWML